MKNPGFKVGDKVRVKGFKQVGTIQRIQHDSNMDGVVLKEAIANFRLWDFRDVEEVEDKSKKRKVEMKKDNLVKAALKNTMADADYFALCITYLHTACGELRHCNDKEAENAFSVLTNRLYQQEIRAVRRVLMMASLDNSKEALEARLAACNRFLAEGVAVMGYLTPKGATPSGWLVSTEKSFRGEIQKKISEIKKRLRKKK